MKMREQMVQVNAGNSIKNGALTGDESCRSAEFLFWLIQISDSRMLMMVLDASYSIEMM